MSDADERQKDWVNAHMGRTSKETAERLLTTPQPRPPADAPILRLSGVRARCVAGGASNFWIVRSEAAEPTLDGEFPMTGISPTAYFIQVPRFNYLPYAVMRADLTAENHAVAGDTSRLETAMRKVYGPADAKPGPSSGRRENDRTDQPRETRARPSSEATGGVRE